MKSFISEKQNRRWIELISCSIMTIVEIVEFPERLHKCCHNEDVKNEILSEINTNGHDKTDTSRILGYKVGTNEATSV